MPQSVSAGHPCVRAQASPAAGSFSDACLACFTCNTMTWKELKFFFDIRSESSAVKRKPRKFKPTLGNEETHARAPDENQPESYCCYCAGCFICLTNSTFETRSASQAAAPSVSQSAHKAFGFSPSPTVPRHSASDGGSGKGLAVAELWRSTVGARGNECKIFM